MRKLRKKKRSTKLFKLFIIYNEKLNKPTQLKFIYFIFIFSFYLISIQNQICRLDLSILLFCIRKTIITQYIPVIIV